MTLQNLHTHTVFSDGKNTPEEMVLGAVRAGCTSLGFSEHSPLAPFYDPDRYAMEAADLPAYRSEILRLREKYAGQLEVYLGLEQDYDSPAPGPDFDYLIGSVHSVVADGVCLSVDNTRETLVSAVREHFGGDFFAFARAYYRRVAAVAETGCQILGHLDLVTKFNEGGRLFDAEDARCRAAALEALEAAMERDMIFEINTGAMSRGYRTAPYPAPSLLKSIRAGGGRICLTSDSHSAQTITYAFPQAAELALACGFREAWVLTEGSFRPVELEALRTAAQKRPGV